MARKGSFFEDRGIVEVRIGWRQPKRTGYDRPGLGRMSRKVLIGESGYAEFEILNEFLSNRGFEVHWVKDGNEAVSKFSEFGPDVMILDALLPGLTGIRVCQQVRELPKGKDVKTILLSTVYRQFKEKYDSRKTVGVDAYHGKPVDLESLEKLIASLLGDEESGDNEEAGQSGSESGGKSGATMSGSLEVIPLPRILYELHKGDSTGALQVQNERVNKVIYVQSGKLSFVSSNQSSESLGRYMVQAGMITVADYNQSLEKMLATQKQQGTILLEMGAVTPHKLYEALYAHVMEKVVSVFAWDSGTYAFKSGKVRLDPTLAVQIDLLDAIRQGIGRFYPLSRLENFFNEYKNHRVFKIEKSDFATGKTALKPAEAKFFRLIDGRRRVGQILARSKLTLTETFQLLYFLIVAEGVRLDGDARLGIRSIKAQKEYERERLRKRRAMRDAATAETVSSDKMSEFREGVWSAFETVNKLNYFELLKVTPDASSQQVKAAYYVLARRFHPADLYQQADDITKAKADALFRTITDAYEALIEPGRRAEYMRKIGSPETMAATHSATEVQEVLDSSFEYEPETPSAGATEPAAVEEVADSAKVELTDEELDLIPEDPEAFDGLDDTSDDDLDLGLELDEPTPIEPLPPTPEPEAPDVPIEKESAEIDFDFGDEVGRPESPSSEVDSEIDWEIDDELDFGEGGQTEALETDDQELEFDGLFESDSVSDEEMMLQEGRQVTSDMASIVKSELAYQEGEDAMADEAFDRAVEKFTDAIGLNPGEAEYHAYLGWALFRQTPDNPSVIDAAVEKIGEALAINPNLDSAHYFTGMIELYQGHKTRARNAFEAALQFNPQHLKARDALERLETP
jgi:CheY-like chemotaxis protein/tetratricopeptide (TPR) repeat protein